MCTGWSYEYASEEMDLIRYKEMMQYHKQNPPLHIMVARYLNFGEKPTAAKAPTEAELEELMSIYPQTSGKS